MASVNKTAAIRCDSSRALKIISALTAICSKQHLDSTEFFEYGNDNLNPSYLVCTEKYLYSEQDSKFNTIIIKCADKDDTLLPYIKNGGHVYTYSSCNNSADIMAKNIVQTDDISHFELLGDNSIGRVINKGKCRFSVDELLAMASVLLLLGLPFEQVTKELSEL